MAQPVAVKRTPVGIVGFAGATLLETQRQQLSAELYAQMVASARRYINETLQLRWDQVTLVSGGAAWADHVAVTLFLAHPEARLVLQLPCHFVATLKQFAASSPRERARRTVATVVGLHRSFSACLGCDSVGQLSQAVAVGAKVCVWPAGFLRRNSAVADLSQRLLAFTWAPGGAPRSGGTHDTWQKYGRSGRKVAAQHVDMNGLVASLSTPDKRPADTTVHSAKRTKPNE